MATQFSLRGGGLWMENMQGDSRYLHQNNLRVGDLENDLIHRIVVSFVDCVELKLVI